MSCAGLSCAELGCAELSCAESRAYHVESDGDWYRQQCTSVCTAARAPAYMKECSLHRISKLVLADFGLCLLMTWSYHATDVDLDSCAFSVAGPVCWNTLPDFIESSDLQITTALCRSDDRLSTVATIVGATGRRDSCLV